MHCKMGGNLTNEKRHALRKQIDKLTAVLIPQRRKGTASQHDDHHLQHIRHFQSQDFSFEKKDLKGKKVREFVREEPNRKKRMNKKKS